MNKTSVPLAVPRTGVGWLHWNAGKRDSNERGRLIAAWQTPEKGAPKRVVIRTDGIITEDADGGGIPCGVLAIRYTIGGLKRQVLVDPLKQNALVVWAESVDVEPVWDDRRINRLAQYSVNPCNVQQVAAAISSSGEHGDSGAADARWIDVLALDETLDDDTEWSVHPIPDGARGVRFLNALVNDANFATADQATKILFSSTKFANLPTGVIETAIDGITDQSIILVPSGAQFMFVQFPAGTFDSFDTAPWVEWMLSPSTLFGG